MIFQSQLRQQAILHVMLLWMPWAMIAGVGAAYFHTGFPEFLVVMASLCVLGSVYWIVQRLVHWVAFILCGYRVSRRSIYDYLIMHQYPAPQEDSISAADYFLSVVKNNTLDPELRMKAAAEVGAFAAYAGAFDRQRLRKISRAAEGAIKQYRGWLASTDLGVRYAHQDKAEDVA